MWVAEQAGPATALTYVDRIKARIDRLRDYPNRGVAKPNLGDGLRSLSFERRLLILYRVDEDIVRVMRVVGAERDLIDLAL